MGLEAREREQSGVPNSGGRVLLMAAIVHEFESWRESDARTHRTPKALRPKCSERCVFISSRRGGTLGVRTRPGVAFICLAPAAIGSWPHRLRVAFAGKEESRGVCPLDSSGR